MASPYPAAPSHRDRWILGLRGERNRVDPGRAHATHVEDECGEDGQVGPVATLFLTNSECPWRCLMCDLWKNSLAAPAPPGSLPAQIDRALSVLPPARRIKLYNSGSFFDRRAVPQGDYRPIADRLDGFERVIVESHPSLVGADCLRFRDMLTGRLEVAMGLETVHPEVLPRLNKRMTLSIFSKAAARLAAADIALRVFILVKPPFLAEGEALEWAKRSLAFAFDCGATAACLIPTRSGNGALDALAERDEFSPPRLASLEAAAAQGLGLGRGRVFADLWDLERMRLCPACFPARKARLAEMNLRQAVLPEVACSLCGGAS